jgi:NAD(P)H dehydrogenase (quinone)
MACAGGYVAAIPQTLGDVMRLLFVYAHPVADSLAAAARDCAMQAAQQNGHELQLIDLYGSGFQPCLTAAEAQSYADPDAMPDDLDPHIDALLWAEGLIFVHPTWWSGLPAILKGWLDRLWRPGVAFHIDPKGLRAGLPNIRLIGVITTLGATWAQYNLLLGAPGRKQLLRGLRFCIHPRARSMFLAHYAIETSSPASRAAFLAKIAARIAQIAV